ncbi:hypothetical protein JCM6882_003968 [Rhodosporidiobolus microsporus]
MSVVSNWSTCGLVWICLMGVPSCSLLILTGCTCVCWTACVLEALAPTLLYVGIFGSLGLSISSGFVGLADGFSKSSGGNGSAQDDFESDKDVKKASVVFTILPWVGLVCYILAVGIGIYMVCRVNPSASAVQYNSLGASSPSALRRRRRRVPRGTLANPTLHIGGGGGGAGTAPAHSLAEKGEGGEDSTGSFSSGSGVSGSSSEGEETEKERGGMFSSRRRSGESASQ